jgi:hypothetical protein
MRHHVDDAWDQSNVSAPFTSLLFSKFSHPVEGLLKRLRRVDSLDVNQLLVFVFTDVIRIRNVCPLPDMQLFELGMSILRECFGGEGI